MFNAEPCNIPRSFKIKGCFWGADHFDSNKGRGGEGGEDDEWGESIGVRHGGQGNPCSALCRYRKEPSGYIIARLIKLHQSGETRK